MMDRKSAGIASKIHVKEPTMSSDSIDEALRRRFEQARRDDPSAQIDAYLPPEDSAEYLPTLEELVLIDLEFGWKQALAPKSSGPMVEAYIARFPKLNRREVCLRLLRYEYELRSKSGAAPSLDEYRARFPAWVATGRELVTAQGDVSRTLGAAGPSGGSSDVALWGDGHVLVSTTESGTASARYSLTRLHAEGGLGRIWVARDGSLERDVALKELKPQTAQDAGAWRRFLREAQVTGQLEHPNIVPVYEWNPSGEDRTPFYTMRLVKGKTLREAVAQYHDRRRAKQSDPLDLPRLLQAFVNVCQAISYAHSRGVIHRDLKPDNIILGDFGEVLVLDWGLAKTRRGDVSSAPAAGPAEATMAADLTTLGVVVGTPAYMAPEQAAAHAEQVDERTDVFGLGAVLFEILTGRPPRGGSNVHAIIEDAVRRPVMRARQALPEVPAALDAVCAKALALAPGDRYPAAVDLAQEVQRYLADEPTTAFRESWTRQGARWARKHRTTVAVATAVGVLSLAVFVIGLFIRQRMESEALRREADAVAELYARTAVDAALADGELRAGRYATAAELLDRSCKQLETVPQLATLHAQLAARLNRTRKLDQFYQGIERGELLEFFEYDDQAEAEIEAALRSVGVWDHDPWWNALPAEDLSPAQLERLREDVFRELLLLASIRAKSALVDFGAADSAKVYREVLELSQRASAWRPSQSARVLEVFARVGLGPLEALKLKMGPAIEPTSQADLYFVGLMQFWFGQTQQDAVNKLLNLLRPFTGMDFTDSLAQSERLLRTAVARDPHHYWTWFFLGWTKLQARDFHNAELVFDTCVALRPDSAIGRSYRGLSILLGVQNKLPAGAAGDAKAGPAGAEQPPTPKADDGEKQAWRTAELARGVADLQRAESLDPTNSEIVYLHARGLVIAGRMEEGKVALLRSLELEPPLTHWAGQRVDVEKRAVLADLVKFAEIQTKQNPADRNAWALWAEGAHRLGDDQAAARAIDEILKQNGQDVLGLTLRADRAVRKGNAAQALGDLERASLAEPKNWRTIQTLADAYTKTEAWERALRGYDQALQRAKTDWQRVASQLGRIAVLDRLDRKAEADQAWAAAKRLDRRAVDPRVRPGSAAVPNAAGK